MKDSLNYYVYQNPVFRIIARIIDSVGSFLFFCIRKNVPINTQLVKRILVVRFDQLGDAFYISPIFFHLKEKFPQAEIDVLCTEATRPIYSHNPYIHTIHTFPYTRFNQGRTSPSRRVEASFKNIWQLIRTLRKGSYDVYIDPRGEPFISFLGICIGARYRVGILYEEVLSFLYTHVIRYHLQDPAWHRYRNMLALLGIKISTWKPQIFLTQEESKQISSLITDITPRHFVAFHISAGHYFKMWPLDYFSHLAHTLYGRGYDIVLCGSASDKKFAKTVISLCPTIPIKDMTGSLSLRLCYAFLKYASLFVGNDSVLAHFAASYDIPTVQLLNGGTSVQSCYALGHHVVTLHGTDTSHQCSLVTCTYPCPHMKNIQPEIVFDALRPFLKE
ncbi:MAG: glycosyltransferase family 9 protein [Candidatus Paceibacterota bacterium]